MLFVGLNAFLVVALSSFGPTAIAQPAPPQAPAQPATRPPAPVAASELVTAQRGTLPIILSAPHGGDVRVPGSEDRKHGVTVKDLRTAELALLVAQFVTAKLGGKPYVVIAQFSRKDADANREAGREAYENDKAKLHYEAYHRALREFVDEVRREHNGRGLLLDLHGQARRQDQILRGTKQGKTVSALIKRAGNAALVGPDSLFGRLAKTYTVSPPLDADEDAASEDLFDGGYIVQAYGSHQRDGIDAIQLEFGGDLRAKDAVWALAENMAAAIAAFAARYLP
ncbi:MAG: hypothetical protein AB7K09_14585 [Planctomycetota bacterium]